VARLYQASLFMGGGGGGGWEGKGIMNWEGARVK